MAAKEHQEKTRDVQPEYIREAGKEKLDDELLPNKGEPVPQNEARGDARDTAGEHGDMAVDAAEGLDESETENR